MGDSLAQLLVRFEADQDAELRRVLLAIRIKRGEAANLDCSRIWFGFDQALGDQVVDDGLFAGAHLGTLDMLG